jgi:hypothetical protein
VLRHPGLDAAFHLLAVVGKRTGEGGDHADLDGVLGGAIGTAARPRAACAIFEIFSWSYRLLSVWSLWWTLVFAGVSLSQNHTHGVLLTTFRDNIVSNLRSINNLLFDNRTLQ